MELTLLGVQGDAGFTAALEECVVGGDVFVHSLVVGVSIVEVPYQVVDKFWVVV